MSFIFTLYVWSTVVVIIVAAMIMHTHVGTGELKWLFKTDRKTCAIGGDKVDILSLKLSAKIFSNGKEIAPAVKKSFHLGK